MGDYFDFNWGKAGEDKARIAHRMLTEKDAAIETGISGVLVACVVATRGKRRSPSSTLETLVNSKRRTNPYIVDHLRDAWNVACEVSEDASDRFDVLLSLITPRHRNNKSGISDTLKYQLGATLESLLDWWIVLADLMVGFRSVSSRVFGSKEMTPLHEYLANGMTRSQLMKSFGHEIRDITDPDDESGDDTEDT